jgi:hypothetical protein
LDEESDVRRFLLLREALEAERRLFRNLSLGFVESMGSSEMPGASGLPLSGVEVVSEYEGSMEFAPILDSVSTGLFAEEPLGL